VGVREDIEKFEKELQDLVKAGSNVARTVEVFLNRYYKGEPIAHIQHVSSSVVDGRPAKVVLIEMLDEGKALIERELKILDSV